MFLSILPSIQLIDVAKAEDIHEYEFDTLLEPFINDMICF